MDGSYSAQGAGKEENRCRRGCFFFRPGFQKCAREGQGCNRRARGGQSAFRHWRAQVSSFSGALRRGKPCSDRQRPARAIMKKRVQAAPGRSGPAFAPHGAWRAVTVQACKGRLPRWRQGPERGGPAVFARQPGSCPAFALTAAQAGTEAGGCIRHEQRLRRRIGLAQVMPPAGRGRNRRH